MPKRELVAIARHKRAALAQWITLDTLRSDYLCAQVRQQLGAVNAALIGKVDNANAS